MKKKISYCLILLIVIGTLLPVYGQDSVSFTPPQIIKEIVIKETKVKIIRDTIVIQSDSSLITSLQALNDKVVAIGKQQELTLTQQTVYKDKTEGHMLVLKWLIGITILLTLAVLMCLCYLVIHTVKINKGHEVKTTQDVNPKIPEEGNKKQTAPIVPDLPKPIKPSLEAYNNSVYEFTVINDHVANLRKRDTKPLVMAMYRFLSLQSVDKTAILSQIRSANISEDVMEQFVALVSRIEAFLTQKKTIIDAWLYYEPKDDVVSYELAIRMPEGLIFDESLDEDVLGDNIDGQQITMVHKMGFYFPGNTIKPYRAKSVVSA